MAHYYWVVRCKTGGCDDLIKAEYIGEWGPSQRPSPLWKQALYVRCPKCGEIHRYTFYERRLLESSDPPDRLQA